VVPVASSRNLAGIYLRWPRLLPEYFDRAAAAGITPPEGVVVGCGMGGSGFSVEAAALALWERGVPLLAVRDYTAPGFVGPGVTVVGVSFSGETLETRSCVRDAARRGARVIAVAGAGSSLAGDVRRVGGEVVEVPREGVARAALPVLLGSILGVLAPDARGLVEGVAGALDAEVALAEARRVAGEISSWSGARRVVVAACGRLALAARRWRSELAENGKLDVQEEEYPEAGHNSVSTWSGRCLEQRELILIRHGSDPLCRVIEGCLAARHCAGNLVEVDVAPQARVHPLAGLLQASMIAGLTGVLLADMAGRDPEATPEIEWFKSVVKRALG